MLLLTILNSVFIPLKISVFYFIFKKFMFNTLYKFKKNTKTDSRYESDKIENIINIKKINFFL